MDLEQKKIQAYWPIIGCDICLTIKSLISHGKLPTSLNNIIITLILKQEIIETSYHILPKSLVNSIYKAIF